LFGFFFFDEGITVSYTRRADRMGGMDVVCICVYLECTRISLSEDKDNISN